MTRPIHEPGSPGWKDPRTNLSRTEFRPYATALGQIALAWNGLHERLAFLFCMANGRWPGKSLLCHMVCNKK